MNAGTCLAELDSLASARFPGEAATLRLFLDELAGSLRDPEAAAVLLGRLEEFLEALLVRERWR